MFAKHLFVAILAINVIKADIGKFEEVYSWKEITFDVNGRILNADQLTADASLYTEDVVVDESNIKTVYPYNGQYYIKENNVPMGVERWGDKLFMTIPRRRYGIPSTLNYIDLTEEIGSSPHFKPYPVNQASLSKRLVSVYRTRIDQCNRLWVVDTGLLQVPNEVTQVQPPAIVIFDLLTDKELLRYELKNTDLVSVDTPGGLASIAVDVINSDCSNTFAYLTDLATFGLIVFSLAAQDSWRVQHNYFSFLPTGGEFNIAGQQFQWNDGVFSLTLGPAGSDSYRTAYFHALASIEEFSVSTEVLRNKTLATRSYHGTDFKLVGDKGENHQASMHACDPRTGTVFFADVSRNAISCWNINQPIMTPENVEIIAQDEEKLVYPGDIHITGDEVWFMSNRFPTFIYSKLNFSDTNFRIFRGTVSDLISGTMCARGV